MRNKRKLVLLAAALLVGASVWGQTVQNPSASPAAGTNPWSFSLTADGYIVPHAEFYVSPTFTADHHWLHLEARYNYEDQYTGSLWVGYNFDFGHKLKLDVTPLIGGVLGNTTGIAPGYQFSLTYHKLSLSSSGEYVFDTKDKAGSFFYSWPELTYSPVDWLRVGLVAQRTKAYHTSLDTQRGFLVGVSHKHLSFTTYIFSPGWATPTVVLEAGINF
jgi:hypothetical protein